MEKYARPVEYSASTAAIFQDKYGDIAGPMATEYNTAYKLTTALRQLDPPFYPCSPLAALPSPRSLNFSENTVVYTILLVLNLTHQVCMLAVPPS